MGAVQSTPSVELPLVAGTVSIADCVEAELLELEELLPDELVAAEVVETS